MSNAIGLDIGGTKIAGAVFDAQGMELAQITLPTPTAYDSFLDICFDIVGQLEQKTGTANSIGIGLPGTYTDRTNGIWDSSTNLPHISGKPLRDDLQKKLNRKIEIENDANCAALAEAMDGAGKGYTSVFGLIMGTGVGGGFVLNGKIISGTNGLCGEIGHLPLPYYEQSDGERVTCGCGQMGCIEKLVAGAALSRLYRDMTDRAADAREIAEQARANDTEALQVLDRYYTVVAKAMVTVLHSFDPDVITVSGGLNALPNMYSEVPKRWNQYVLNKKSITKFVPATFGAIAGLRGAAWLGKTNSKSCG